MLVFIEETKEYGQLNLYFHLPSDVPDAEEKDVAADYIYRATSSYLAKRQLKELGYITLYDTDNFLSWVSHMNKTQKMIDDCETDDELYGITLNGRQLYDSKGVMADWRYK